MKKKAERKTHRPHIWQNAKEPHDTRIYIPRGMRRLGRKEVQESMKKSRSGHGDSYGTAAPSKNRERPLSLWQAKGERKQQEKDSIFFLKHFFLKPEHFRRWSFLVCLAGARLVVVVANGFPDWRRIKFAGGRIRSRGFHRGSIWRSLADTAAIHSAATITGMKTKISPKYMYSI